MEPENTMNLIDDRNLTFLEFLHGHSFGLLASIVLATVVALIISDRV